MTNAHFDPKSAGANPEVVEALLRKFYDRDAFYCGWISTFEGKILFTAHVGVLNAFSQFDMGEITLKMSAILRYLQQVRQLPSELTLTLTHTMKIYVRPVTAEQSGTPYLLFSVLDTGQRFFLQDVEVIAQALAPFL